MRKNPLNDLDRFLQQEASSVVPPSPLSNKLNERDPSPTYTETNIEEQLLKIAQEHPNYLYNLLITVAEKMDVVKNTMLINTALYLKHGENWREAVKEYWKK